MLNDFHNTLFDSHSHFFGTEFDHDRGEVVARAVEAGVAKIIDVAVDLPTAELTLSNAQKYPDVVLPTIGIHPEMFVPGSDLYDVSYDEQRLQADIAEIDKILQVNPGYVMIGECGMDLYWLRQNKVTDEILVKSKEMQIAGFKSQVELAAKHKLPLTIHARDSVNDCLAVLQASQGDVQAIFHSFTGDYEELKRIIDAGFAIGINGIVTYKSAVNLREALKKYIGGKEIREPRDLYDLGVYLETDAPWLAPTGTKGLSALPDTSRLRNEPKSVADIFELLPRLN